MSMWRQERASDSSLVARITRVRYEQDTQDVTAPDGCWDLVVMKVGGRVRMLQTGLITKPVVLGYQAGDEYLAISFRPGVFRPRLPGVEMLDRGLLLPCEAPGLRRGPSGWRATGWRSPPSRTPRGWSIGWCAAS